MSKGTGQSDDGSLCCGVYGQVGRWDCPTDGTHIDNRSLASLRHAGDNSLSHKKLMLQVDSHGLIPEVRAHLLDCVARVVASVVHQDVDFFGLGEDRFDRYRYRRDVRQVAVIVGRWS